MGKFELADTGTIFLDEIGDMPLESQAMLLRVIEQKDFMKLGSNRLINVDVKIISATNANLENLIQQKLFRSDLFYRLSVIKLNIPPLRRRQDDIIPLARHFANAAAQHTENAFSREITFSREAERLLLSLPWPGNVRELQHVIEGIVILYQPRVIEARHIQSYMDLQTAPIVSAVASHAAATSPPLRHRIAPKSLSRDDIVNALQRNRYNKSAAADFLGISRKSFYRKMQEFGLL